MTAHDGDAVKDGPEGQEPAKFTAEEEGGMATSLTPTPWPMTAEKSLCKALLQESHCIKTEANALFSSQDFPTALARYHDAVSSCPGHRHYEHSVLQSNIAATNLKLGRWEEAIAAATECLDGLAKLDKNEAPPDSAPDEGGVVEEMEGIVENARPRQDCQGGAKDEIQEDTVSSTGVPHASPISPPRPRTPPATADILRIRIKALLRRARARSEIGDWKNLAAAEDDYRTLSSIPGLGPADARTVRLQFQALPPRTKAAQEREMGEMWGKLRQLGDGILKPFGLSTQNFQMVKDEATGGYSVNFNHDRPSPPS